MTPNLSNDQLKKVRRKETLEVVYAASPSKQLSLELLPHQR